MCELGASMHAESSYNSYRFDPAKVKQTLEDIINSDIGIPIVAERDGVLIGGMVGLLVSHYFGPDKVAIDYALFIAQEERRGRLGLKILKAWIEEAKSLGADQISIANSTGVEIDKVKALYEFVGFKQVGYVFHMGVR